MVITQLKAIKWLLVNIGCLETINIFIEIILRKPKKHLVKFRFKKRKIRMQICSERTDLAMLTEIFCFESYEIKKEISPKFIVDGGANKGSATIYFGIKYPEATIHCYEPNIDLIPILQKNIELNKIRAKVYNQALSDKNGPLFFEKNANHQYSKITKQNTGLKISTVTLEKKYPNKKIDILKLDVEGEENNIIKSLKKSNIDIIIQEIHYDRVNYKEIKTSLEKNGYKFEKPYPQYHYLNPTKKYPILLAYKRKI